jgi:aspartate 1-decarboxylase
VLVNLLKSKIHRATVTQVAPSYVGSIALDGLLMEAAGILEHERLLIANLATGGRFETYCIRGERGSGIVSVNGAAARLASPGDKVIIMAFTWLGQDEAASHSPRVVFVGEGNGIVPGGAA